MRLRYSRELGAARRTEGPAPLPAVAARFAPGAGADFAVVGRLAVATGTDVLVDERAADALMLPVAFAAGAAFDFVIVVGRLAVATGVDVLVGVRAADPPAPLDLPAVRAACELREVFAERGDWSPGRRVAPLAFFAML